jgi:hypothetical protein
VITEMPMGISTISATPARKSDALLLASVDAIGFEGNSDHFRELRHRYWLDAIPETAYDFSPREAPVLIVQEMALYIGWGLRQYSGNDRVFLEAYFSPGRESDNAINALIRAAGVDPDIVYLTDPRKLDSSQAV